MIDREMRWGILGAGRIAHRFAASLAQVPGTQVVAVAGRSSEKLQKFIDEAQLPGALIYAADALDDVSGDAAYKALLADASVDAVYLSLPHGLHECWAVAALKAGKAVLCEKPAVLDEGQARHIADAARSNGMLFMEAMKNRFCPLHDRVWEILRAGELGAIEEVESVQTLRYHEPPTAYLLDPEQGGALLDMGCYAVGWFEELCSGEAALCDCAARWREASVPGERVDWAGDVHMEIGGVPVHMLLDGAAEYRSQLSIACERGAIVVDRLHRPENAVVHRADGSVETIEAPYEVDDFYGQISHFVELWRGGAQESPVMPLDATIRCARLLDAIRVGFDGCGELD